MKKLFLLEALESFNDDQKKTISEDEIVDSIFTLRELKDDADEKAEELEEMFSEFNDIDQSIFRLETIRNVIMEYGISAPMMMAVDYKRELVAAGISPAYEELSTDFVNDINATAVVEGIIDTIKSAFSRLVEFFKKMGIKIKDWMISNRKTFNHYESSIKKYQHELRIMTIDEDLFAKQSVKSLSKAEFQEVLGAYYKVSDTVKDNNVTKLIDELILYIKGADLDIVKLNKISKSIVAPINQLAHEYKVLHVLGIRIEEKHGEIVSIRETNTDIKDQRRTVTEHGWLGSDVISVCDTALNVLNNANVAFGQMDSLYELCMATARVLYDKLAIEDRLTDDNRVALYEAVRSCEHVSTLTFYLLLAIFKIELTLCSSAEQLAIAAVKSKAH